MARKPKKASGKSAISISALDVLTPEDRLLARPWAASIQDHRAFTGSPLWSDIRALVIRRIEQSRSELETMTRPDAVAHEQGRIAAYREILLDIAHVLPQMYEPATADTTETAEAPETPEE